MEIIAMIAALLFLVLAAYFFNENNNLHKRVVDLDGQLREAQHKKSAKSKPAEKKSADPVTVSADPELERDLDDARAEIKDLKKQIYDLKKNSKDLREQVKEAAEDRTADVPDSDVIFDLRAEIAQLKTENVRLQDELKSSSKAARPAPRPEPKPEPKPEAPPAAAAATSTGSSADVDDLRAKYEKELDTLRGEVRDLGRKLKSTSSNVDKQRRRADNNDRAYKITQRQYDAAQERVSLLEAKLSKSGIALPPLPEAESPTPVVSPGPAKITPAMAAEVAAEKAEKAAQAAKQAAQPTPPKSEPAAVASAPDESAADEPAPPVHPGAVLRKAPRPTPEPEVGSTTVLSPMALATAGKKEDDEKEDEGGSTLHRAKPVMPEDVAESKPAPTPAPPKPTVDDAKPAKESGGHTAVMTPAALAASFPTGSGDEESERSEAAESGGHTAVMSSASLSQAVTAESKRPQVDDDASEAEEAEETAERTAMLSPSMMGGKSQDEPEGGRRPSSGLFGMPDDLLKAPAEEQDAARSTQFAFPTQIVDEPEEDDATGGTTRFAPPSGSDGKSAPRLGGRLGGGDNPAAEPVPGTEPSEGTKDDSRLGGGGGRLGDMDFGDLGSAIDDAWGDIDID